MKDFYINKIHLNNFKKYVLKKEKENHLLKLSKKNKNIKNKNNLSFTLKNNGTDLLLSHNDFKKDEDKKNIGNPVNKIEKEINQKYNFREYFIKLSKKNNSLMKKFKKNHKISKTHNKSSFNILSSIKKTKFNINNIINSSLFHIFKNKTYKRFLIDRINPYYQKKVKSINLDLRKDINNTSKIAKNKKLLTPRYIYDKSNDINKNKKEFGIQASYSCEHLSKNINDKCIDKDNCKFNKINLLKRCKSTVDRNKKKIFNKYDEKNKTFLKNNSLVFRINNRYEKLKNYLSIQSYINLKILNKLKLEQNMSNTNIKLGLVKLEGYETRRNKKINNNSYNIFL